MLHWDPRTGAKDVKKEDFLATIHQIRQETYRRRTILNGWRATGIHPFNPEVVLRKLREWEETSGPPTNAQPAKPKDPQVNRPLTPTCTSPDIERMDAQGDSSRDSYLRSRAQMAKNQIYWAKLEGPNPIKYNIFVPQPGTSSWSVPNDLATLEAQMKSIQGIIKRTLTPSQAIDIERTLIVATAWAATAESFKRQLGLTEAARIAREERRKRSRRTLQVKGGVVYAKDARNMVRKRKEDEITKQEKELQGRKNREARALFNKYKRLLPSIRAAAKRAQNRYLNRTLTFVNKGLRLLDPDQCQAAAVLSEDSVTTAVEQGLLTRGILDPYKARLTAIQEAKEWEERIEIERVQAVNRLDTQATVMESEDDDIADDSEDESEFEVSDAGDST